MKSVVRFSLLPLALAWALFAPLAAPAQDAPAPVAPTAPASPEAGPEAAAPQPPAPAAERAAPAPPDARPDAGITVIYDRRSVGNDFPLGDHIVPRGSSVSEVVSILGSSTVEGQVRSDVVSILGNTTVRGGAMVGGEIVTVRGDLDLQGYVRGEVVNVLGEVKINGRVGQDLVAVLGDLTLGPDAVIEGDVVLAGGRLIRHPNALIRGNLISAPNSEYFGSFNGIIQWVRHCGMWLRPLSFHPDIKTPWGLAVGFLAFYVVLALLFRRSAERCMETLTTRPGRTIFASIFAVVLAPITIVLLSISIVGIPVLPFLFVGLLCAVLFGKTVMLALIGRPFTRFFGDGPLGHVAVSVLVGGIVTMLLYTVPFFGGMLFVLLGWLGFSVVVYTVILASKREKPPAPVPPVAPPPPPAAPRPPVVPVVPVVPVASVPLTAVPVESVSPPPTSTDLPPPVAPPPTFTPPPPPPAASVPPPAPSYQPRINADASLPRVGFWLRLGALVLDVMLFMVFFVLWAIFRPDGVILFNPLALLPWLAAYAAVMWKLKGTTVGGVVCGLKVVRVDGRELDWPTTIARALGCFLSLIVAGLGFIWVAFDGERQSWHDKIAGTTVVRVPPGTSLL